MIEDKPQGLSVIYAFFNLIAGRGKKIHLRTSQVYWILSSTGSDSSRHQTWKFTNRWVCIKQLLFREKKLLKLWDFGFARTLPTNVKSK